MAPPPNRRSGYSRRAQYGTFFGYIAGIVGALVGGGFLIVSIFDSGSFAGLRGVAADAAEPGGKVVAESRAASHSFFDVVRGYAVAGVRNAKLERELAEAKIRLVEAQAIAEENARLKGLLGLVQQDPAPVVTTQLVAATGGSTRRFATLGAGSGRGVMIGMPVRSPLGLVGRVLEVGSSTARVLLVTDTESVVPVRRAQDGVAAFAQGLGDGRLQLRLINLGINPLKPGDVFVTSGSGGLYRPGIALAAVTSITRDGAIARVLADPAATEFVTVDRVWAPQPEPTPVASGPAAPPPAAPGPR
ncbi:MAG: rod shape-determining protein MreC [Novosphingobium sp.]|nr:MAG: rod shape-determining protein MreC [Novosphingobium sp.]